MTGWSRRRRMLAAERFRAGQLPGVAYRRDRRKARAGLTVDAAALASAVKLAREVAAETGLAPARVDGLLALKGVIVQDEVGDARSGGARPTATPRSWKAWPLAFDALVKARAQRRRQAGGAAARRRSMRSSG